MPKIVCLSGANADSEYKLPDGDCEISFGRSDENDICVLDRKSSRFHCKLKLTAGVMTLEDLNSTNGVFVNHQPIEGRKQIGYGDFISIGQTVFTVMLDPNGVKKNVKSGVDLLKDLAQENGARLEVTKTTTFRRIKMEQSGSHNGFLSFFENKESGQ